MVTDRAALSASILSDVTLKDLTSGSCELVTGSKSTGPTSPFGVWASALAHSATSDFDRYFALAALSTVTKAAPPSPLPLAARVEIAVRMATGSLDAAVWASAGLASSPAMAVDISARRVIISVLTSFLLYP